MSNEETRIMPGNFGLDQCEHSDFERGPYTEIPAGGPHKRWVRVKPAEWERFLATAPAAHPTSSAQMRDYATQAKPNEYCCAACQGVFKKGWSEDEAKSELGEVFPGFTTDDCALVCDDCYKKMGFGQ